MYAFALATKKKTRKNNKVHRLFFCSLNYYSGKGKEMVLQSSDDWSHAATVAITFSFLSKHTNTIKVGKINKQMHYEDEKYIYLKFV
jgi:hypothetical protein